MKKPDDQYSKEESEKRMAAALRGARLAMPKPMDEIPKKRVSKKAASAPRKEKK